MQMLHPSELRFKFSDVDGNERTKTFTYSNGQTGTALLTYMAGNLGKQVAGASVTLETLNSKRSYPAVFRGESGFSIDIPASSAVNFNTHYTLTPSGFSPFWNSDAIVIDPRQTLSFKTADAAFTPPYACGMQGNAPCLLTPALCTWNNPCILGSAKQNYYLENPASPLTFGLLENNYRGTDSVGFELVFKASGLPTGTGRGNYTADRAATVRYSSRGDVYLDHLHTNLLSRAPSNFVDIGWTSARSHTHLLRHQLIRKLLS